MRDPTQTAIRLIARDRAAGLSLVDVGRESGYSHALPNFYFKYKRLLLLEVYAHIVNSAKANIARWARDNAQGGVTPGLQNVFATIRGYLNLAVEDPMSTRALHKLRFESVSSMPQLLEAVQPWSRRFVSFFERQLESAIQRGEVAALTDVTLTTQMIISMLSGAVAQWLVDP